MVLNLSHLTWMLVLSVPGSVALAQSADSLLADTLPGESELDVEEALLLLEESEDDSGPWRAFGLSRLSFRSGGDWGSASRPANPSGSLWSMRLLATFVAPFGIKFGGVLEKDAYEPVIWDPGRRWRGPDVSRLYASLDSERFQAVFGRFRVQSGAGLLLGRDPSGFLSRKSPTSVSPGRLRLAPVRGASELNLPSGVGIAWQEPVRIVLFGSRVLTHASLATSDGDTLLVDVTSGGRHVTRGALHRRARVDVRSVGIAGEWTWKAFRIGGAALATRLTSPWKSAFSQERSGWSLTAGFDRGGTRINGEAAFLPAGTSMWDVRGRFRTKQGELRLDIAMRNGRASSLFGENGRLHYATAHEGRGSIFWLVKRERSSIAGGTGITRRVQEETLPPLYLSDTFLFAQRSARDWTASATLVASGRVQSRNTSSPEGTVINSRGFRPSYRLETGIEWRSGRYWSGSVDYRTLLLTDQLFSSDQVLHLGGRFSRSRLDFAAGIWLSALDIPGGRLYGYEPSVTGAFGLVSFTRPSSRIYVVLKAQANAHLSLQVKFMELVRHHTVGDKAALSEAAPLQRSVLFQLIWKR